MSDHIREDRLNDYVDDLLCREERAEVESHLIGCDACTAAVARLRDLVTGLGALPVEIAPGTDLLSGIHAAIDSGTVDAARKRNAEGVRNRAGTGSGATEQHAVRDRFRFGFRTPSAFRFRRPLAAAAAAAAAVLLVGGALAIGYALGAGARTGEVAEGPRAPVPVPAGRSVQLVDAQYADATAELERLLAQNADALQPETVRIIEENLAVIDRALAEARAALADDPGNPMLEHILMANHQKKLDLLRRAAQVGA